MITIKIVLIVILLFILRAFLVQKSLMLVKRAVAVIMFAGLLLLVLFPDASTWLANKAGIGRGADLLFYFAHLFFLLVAVALWRKLITLNEAVTRLAREIAINKATPPDGTDK
jgi:small membrane protein